MNPDSNAVSRAALVARITQVGAAMNKLQAELHRDYADYGSDSSSDQRNQTLEALRHLRLDLRDDLRNLDAAAMAPSFDADHDATERPLDDEGAIVATLDACRTMEDLYEVLSRVISACSGNRAHFDEEGELGPDSIAVLAEGAVLAWGCSGSHRGFDTRELVIYVTPDEYIQVMTLDRSAELLDGTIEHEAP